MFEYPSIRRTLSLILAFSLVLSACSGLTQSDKPAINVWWLQPVSDAPQVNRTTGQTPVVLHVSVVPGLDSDKILTLSGDAQLKPYAGARWADDLPVLVDSLLARSLQASGQFDVLQRGRAGAANAACEIGLEVNEFFAEIDSGGRTRGVKIAVDGEYRCGSADPLELALHASVGVNEERMSDVIAAFQKALDQVTLDMINKIINIQ